MADNYLEKKMEEFRSGKKAIRRPSASLESLLTTLAGNDAGGDAGGVVGGGGAGVAGAAGGAAGAVRRAGHRKGESVDAGPVVPELSERLHGLSVQQKKQDA